MQARALMRGKSNAWMAKMEWAGVDAEDVEEGSNDEGVATGGMMAEGCIGLEGATEAVAGEQRARDVTLLPMGDEVGRKPLVVDKGKHRQPDGKGQQDHP